MAGATEVYSFQVTVQPGTLASAPLVTALPMPTRTVKKIRVRIPDGWNGNVGYGIGSAGVVTIPTVPGTWITASGESIEYLPEDVVDSGSWQVQLWNVGAFAHTIYLYFTVELPDVADPQLALSPIVAADISTPPVIVAPTVTDNLPAAPELT